MTKITIDRKVLEQALDALENGKRVRNLEGGTKYQPDIEDAAIYSMREALAQPAVQPTGPAGEPVAWAVFTDAGNARMWTTFQPHIQKLADSEGLTVAPLYTRPAVPLTDEHMCEAMRKAADDLLDHIYEFSTISEGVNPRLLAVGRSIEAAHKIGSQP